LLLSECFLFVVSVYFIIGSVQKLLDTPLYTADYRQLDVPCSEPWTCRASTSLYIHLLCSEGTLSVQSSEPY